MLREIVIRGHVSIPKEYLDKTRGFSQSLILTELLKELVNIKSTKKHGYYIAITKLNSIGNGELKKETQKAMFPVSLSCRTFLPIKGETMLGVVYKVCISGVFLRCGPMGIIYLSSRKMPGFHYSETENGGMFVRDDLSKIQNDVVVCFVVYAVRWARAIKEKGGEFNILASLEGDCLGPVSLSGSDELDL